MKLFKFCSFTRGRPSPTDTIFTVGGLDIILIYCLCTCGNTQCLLNTKFPFHMLPKTGYALPLTPNAV